MFGGYYIFIIIFAIFVLLHFLGFIIFIFSVKPGEIDEAQKEKLQENRERMKRIKKYKVIEPIDAEKRYNKKGVKFNSYTETVKEAKTEEIANQIREHDEYFSDEKFIGFVEEVFSKISEDMSKNEYEHIRMLTVDEVFDVYKKEIDQYKEIDRVRTIEKNRYPYCELTDYRIENDKEVLEVELHVILRDYIKSTITGNVMEGFPYKDWHERYILTFIRENGVKTKDEVFDSQKCPNCGAPLKINYVGECEYCKSIVSTGKYSWVLSNVDRKYRTTYFNTK